MIKNLIFSEGRNILISSLLALVILFFLQIFLSSNLPKISLFISILFLLILIFLAFTFYFFRNPCRTPESIDKDILICPADGKVVDIVRGDFEGFSQKVSIFLSPLDVHVNWIPMSGKILNVKYKEGEFVPAYVPKSSILNERNDIIIEDNMRVIIVRQIAGRIARRIVCWVKKGDDVSIGQKYGMIKFSSRVDILLPKNVSLSVKLNQRVVGGKTILGRWI